MSVGVLAHQGGWDEALLVASPVLVFAGVVWNAKRRAVRQSQHGEGGDSRSDGDRGDGDSQAGSDSRSDGDRGGGQARGDQARG